MRTLSLKKVKSLLGVGAVAALALSLSSPAGAGPGGLHPVGPTPRCYQLDGTSCATLGATQACTDVCGNNLSCTCTYYYSDPSVWFWMCDWEC
jgi:hypothetical protein